MIENQIEINDRFMNITHKDDLDGLGCGIVAKCYAESLDMEFNLMELGYKDVDEKIYEFINSGEYKKYKIIAITDLGIKPDTAELIEEARKEFPEIEWELLDHHDSNIFLNSYDWTLINTRDEYGIPQSAARLAYAVWRNCIRSKYKIYLSSFVKNVSDYDTYIWRERGNQTAKDMHDFMCLVGREEFRKRIIDKLATSSNNVEQKIYSEVNEEMFSNEEKFVIDINKKKIKNYIDRKMNYLEFMKLKLPDGRIFNVAITIIDEKEYSSELGNYICENIPEKADITMMICPAAQDVSMRCVRDDINLGEDIAKPCGGGGHKKAAGFRIAGIKNTLMAGVLQKLHSSVIVTE
jgi:oligoribonuclease NrnB/cAMP/cGMP phosphodiesterase (DHH superfamily)